MTKNHKQTFFRERYVMIVILIFLLCKAGFADVTGSVDQNSLKITGQLLDTKKSDDRDSISNARSEYDALTILLAMLNDNAENFKLNGTVNIVSYCKAEGKPKYRLSRGSLLTYMLRLKLCELTENKTWLEEECQERLFAINDYHSAVYMKFCNPRAFYSECKKDANHDPAVLLYMWMALNHVQRPTSVYSRNNSDTTEIDNQTAIDEKHCKAIASFFDSILPLRSNISGGYSSDNLTLELNMPFYNVQYSEWFLRYRPFCNPSACGVSRSNYENYTFSAYDECLPSSCRAAIILVIAIDALLAVLIIVANFLVLAAATRTTVMHNIPGYFKISLAIADLIVGLVVLPGSIYHHTVVSLQSLPFRMEAQEPDVTDYFDRRYLNVMGFFTVWSFSVSIYTMGAASIDRYLAVTKPFQYKQRKYLTKRRSIAVFALVWFFGFAISIYPIFTAEPYVISALGLILSTGFLAVIVYAISLGLPLLAMWIINLALLGHVCSDKKTRRSLSASTTPVSAFNEPGKSKQAKKETSNGQLNDDVFEIDSGNVNNNYKDIPKRISHPRKATTNKFRLPNRLSLFTSSMQSRFKRRFSQTPRKLSSSTANVERRLAKTLGVMVGAFTLAILPSIIILSIQPVLTLLISPHIYPKTYSTSTMTAYTSLEYIASRLFLSNSFWNCIIYSVRNRHFRRAVVDVFICDEDKRRKRRNTIASSTSKVRRDRNATKVSSVEC